MPVAATGVTGVPESAAFAEYVEKLKALPQYNDFGALFKTCSPVQLTEEDTEYNVSVVKHIFESHIVFQFHCTNTIEEQVLEDVSVAMDLAEAVWKISALLKALTALYFFHAMIHCLFSSHFQFVSVDPMENQSGQF